MKRTRSLERLGPFAKYEVARTWFPNLVSHGKSLARRVHPILSKPIGTYE